MTELAVYMQLWNAVMFVFSSFMFYLFHRIFRKVQPLAWESIMLGFFYVSFFYFVPQSLAVLGLYDPRQNPLSFAFAVIGALGSFLIAFGMFLLVKPYYFERKK